MTPKQFINLEPEDGTQSRSQADADVPEGQGAEMEQLA
jgi:hypothetical protein